MKILITEKQLKKLINEENVITDKFSSIIKNIKNIDVYKEIIPNMALSNYRDNRVKRDAFRHILASAFFTTTIGEKLTWFSGQSVEFLGALKSYLKGEGFDSGWIMDSKNNSLGINIGKQNPKTDIGELSKIVKKVVDSGNFYTKKGILFKNDPNPEK